MLSRLARFGKCGTRMVRGPQFRHALPLTVLNLPAPCPSYRFSPTPTIVRAFSSGPWVNEANTVPGSNLKKFGIDLTQKARDGLLDPVIGREEEIRRTIQILSRRTKNNPVLVGPAGVGKTAIIEGLAQRIVNGEVPDSMKNKKVISLDLAAVLSGASFRGSFEERIKGIVKDVTAAKDEYILFIDEIHMLVQTGQGDGGTMDAANILKPALARGELRCVGATTLDEYRKYIEKDAALARRFQSVYVAEPSVEDTLSILRGIKEKYEVHHGVRIADAALVAAATLSHRYITDRFLPDKAVDLIDEAASRLHLQQESRPEPVEVLDKKIIQLKIEREALRKETDKASKQRLMAIEAELSVRQKEYSELEAAWHAEKRKLELAKEVKEKLEAARRELEAEQRRGNWSRVAEINYSVLPSLEKQLHEYESAEKSTDSSSTEAAAVKRMVSTTVTAEDVADVISRHTGIPVASMLQGEKEKLLHLEEFLRERVVGQDETIHEIANAIRLSRAGLKTPGRPVGSFLFVGPTGVGKTNLCKAIAEALFDSADAMTVINMSELGEKHTVSRLIGTTAGYVGYGEGGQLTEPVRRRPYQLVLLDECEKAHRDILQILLQVMDEGTLTDGQGRKVDFKNTLLVLTSNLGSDLLSQLPADASREEQRAAVMNAVRGHMSPEFINRLDAICLFNRLSMRDMKKITDLRIKELAILVAERGVQLVVDDLARDWLTSTAYDPIYGARPLRRVLQQAVMSPLAVKMLNGDVKDGDRVLVSYDPHTSPNAPLEQQLSIQAIKQESNPDVPAS